MDDIKSQKVEKPKRRRNAIAICRETGDHVHYPPTRLTKSKRPHHAPSPNLNTGIESIFRLNRKPHYGECKKNQSDDISKTAYDGCGEFVIAGEEDSLNCAACGCHRSFHLEKSISDGIPAVLEELNISSNQFSKIFCSPYDEGKNERKEEDSSGGDRIAGDRSGGNDLAEGRRKKLKTKFTAEQKEKMRNYAEKLLWKLSPENREEIDKFCEEIGVNRKQFGAWMSNHKVQN